MMTKSLRVLIYIFIQTAVTAGLLGDCSGATPAASLPKAALGDREVWDVFCIQGSRVGYGRTTLRHVAQPDGKVVKIDGLIHIAVQRFGETTVQDMEFSSTETPEGSLLDFQSEMRQGPTPLRTTGRVRGNRLELKMTTAGKDMALTIPWSAQYGGLYATEESLLRKPMEPGQKRTIQAFDIAISQVVRIDMTARSFENVPLLAGSFKLLHIDTVMHLPDGQTMKEVMWTDAAGETLKSRSEAMNIETFRAPKAVALAKTGPVKLDLGRDIMVKVTRPLPRAHDSKRIRYRVVVENGDPLAAFTSGPSQQVKAVGPHAAEVTVYAIRPGKDFGNRQAAAEKPTDAARQPNNFIQSDDAKVVADAKEAAGKETDPWRVALALEQYVHRVMTQKNFSEAFATAADVARNREGDCTEHAVYLAALARARGIPARVAVGLVYMQGANAFGYHMWTEVYIDKRWIPVDGTLGKGGIGAAHLKLGQSTLEGTSAYSSFLPVVQVTGRLKVEILEVE